MKHFFLLLISIAVGFSIVFGIHFFSPQKSTVVTNPLTLNEDESPAFVFSKEYAPSETIPGIITALSGDTRWESRTATYPASITSSVSVGQGEKLVTGNNSSMTVSFADIVNLELFSNTNVDIVQTLPTNFVFQQYEGTIRYGKKGNTPIAVRSLYLLQEIDRGEAIITISRDPRVVETTVLSGQVTVAYNSLDFVSQIATVAAGKRFIFDDANRELEILNR